MSGGGRYPGVLELRVHGHEAVQHEGGGRQEQQAQEQVDYKLLHRTGRVVINSCSYFIPRSQMRNR